MSIIEPGLFISLEGIEGAGKSTHMDFISEYFEAKGRELVTTREPGGTKLGEAIRSTLLSTDYQDDISEDSELLMMFAARAQHIHEIIKPALASGKVVICDRFTDSSFAYQGGGRGISDKKISRLKDWLQGGFDPDITFLFDLPVEVGLERAGTRGAADRFETEQIDFFVRVRNKYLELAENDKDRFKLIDANEPISTIQKNITELLNQRCLN